MAEENLPDRWLNQERVLSYCAIIRFRISDELESLIEQSLENIIDYLRKQILLTTLTLSMK